MCCFSFIVLWSIIFTRADFALLSLELRLGFVCPIYGLSVVQSMKTFRSPFNVLYRPCSPVRFLWKNDRMPRGPKGEQEASLWIIAPLVVILCCLFQHLNLWGIKNLRPRDSMRYLVGYLSFQKSRLHCELLIYPHLDMHLAKIGAKFDEFPFVLLSLFVSFCVYWKILSEPC